MRKQPLGGALRSIRTSMIPLQTGAVAPDKAPLPRGPAVLTRHIKETAYFLRADQMGVCELPPCAVYSKTIDMFNLGTGEKPVDLPHKYAIAVLVGQDWRTAHTSSGHDWISGSMSMLAYANSGFIANTLADYIRRLGYPAEAHHAPNYRVVVLPILLWAGLGEMSRIGDCVVYPFLGPRFKAAVVATDLPLVPDKPIDFGLQDFCSKCKKCARECPSEALSDGGKEMHKGYEKWPLDAKKRTSMRVGNQKGLCCGTCLTLCPGTSPTLLSTGL